MTTCSKLLHTENQEVELIEGFEAIVSFLDKLKVFETKMFLSSESGNERVSAELALVNPFSQELILRPFRESSFPHFEGEKIRIENEKKNISFLASKGSICRPHYINIKTPALIKVVNLRQAPRLNFDELNIKMGLINHKIRNFQMETQKLPSQLIDISSSGVAIKSINASALELKTNDRLTITSLNNIVLDKNLSGTVAYVKNLPSTVVSSGLFHIGVKFTNEIDLEALLTKLKMK